MAEALAWRTSGTLRYVVVPPRLGIVATPRAGAPGTFVPMTAAQARALLPAAAVVLDGPMFSVCGPDGARRPGESEVARYARVGCGSPDYRVMDTARGIDAPGRYPSRGVTFSLAGGRAYALNGNALAVGAEVAVQTYPPLVRNGRIVATNVGPNAERNWRVGIGVVASGDLIFAVGQADMVAFATAMRSAGARDAGYTDGGGSARGELSNGARVGSSENRRVPIWIAALGAPETPPPVTPSTPSGSNGQTGGGGAGPVVAIGAAAVATWGVGKWRGWW